MSLAQTLRARPGLLIWGTLGSVVALGLLGAALAWATQDGSPPAQGRLSVAGLHAHVEIIRDRLGVVHIRAEDPHDAYLGLGFAHAQDRLWQMELLRRSARGRLSELFGPPALDPDRLARTLAFGAAADAEWLGVSQEVRALLGAYSDGVNRWFEEVDAGRIRAPLELRWLGRDPERWKPQDTLAIVRLRAWLVSRSLGASLLLDRLVRTFGGVASSDFFPVRPSDGAHDTLATLLELGRTVDALARSVGLRGRVGSLGFVVGAARSATGAPLLANDSHVELGLPALFYMAHLDTPKLELSGATWPGIPVFWTGTNGTLAWGQVATHASVTELVKETLHPEAPPRYELNGRWLAAESRVETIRVSGAPDEVVEIQSTRNGPLLGALLPGDPNARALALRWAGSGPRSGVEALLLLQRSGSWTGFRRALERYPGPVATFLYADAKQIGRQVAGNLPIRVVQTTLLPVIGGSRYYDWRGFIPFEKLPSDHSSTRPWLIASTHPEELGYRRRVSWLWSSPGAAARLRTRLVESPPLDLAGVLTLQREQESGRGRHAVRELFDGVELKSANAVTLQTILRDWDGRTDAGSRGALVYHAFRRELTRELLNLRLGPDWATRSWPPLSPCRVSCWSAFWTGHGQRPRPTSWSRPWRGPGASCRPRLARIRAAGIGGRSISCACAMPSSNSARGASVGWVEPLVGVRIPSVAIPIRSGRCTTARFCGEAPTWDPGCATRSIWRIWVMRSSAWPGGSPAIPGASTTTTGLVPGSRAVPRHSGCTTATSLIIESDPGSCVCLESRPRK